MIPTKNKNVEEFSYKYDELFNVTLKALVQLGGSAFTSEIEDTVSTILKLSETKTPDIHRGNVTELSYRLAWARNYLKRYGLVENPDRGIWTSIGKARKAMTVNPLDIKRRVRKLDKKPIKTQKQKSK